MDIHLLIGEALACVLWRVLRTPPWTKGGVNRMFGKMLALVGMKMPPYPAEVIRVMRGLRKNEDAQINVELIRRVPF